MTQHKPWDRIKVTRIFLLLLLDILLINLSSFLALFTRMELDLTALLESGFLDSIYRYALMDTVCTILIFCVLPVVQQPLGLRRYQRTHPNCRRFYCGRSGQVRGHAPVGLADAQKLPSAELYVSHGLCGLQPLGLPLFPGHPAPQPEERSSKSAPC